MPPKSKGTGSVRNQVIDQLDQGGLGYCTLNGIAQMIRMREKALYPASMPSLPSRLYLGYNTHYLMGAVDKDNGADPRTVMKATKRWGVPAEHWWPYVETKFADVPAHMAYMNAFDHRRPYEYYWISRNDPDAVEKVKLAIDCNYGVGIGTGIGEKYVNWKAGDEPLTPPNEIGGMHFMVLTAHDQSGLECLGSWGTTYGDQGYWRFDYSYLTWSYTTSLLVVEKAPKV